MEQAEWLDKCMKKLGVTSDYRLAALLNIPRMRISDYRLDKIKFDEYACFKIADVLGDSPTRIIAQVQAKKAKNEGKRLFFQQFFMIAGLWITLGVMLPLLGTSTGSAYADGITTKNHINQTYNSIMRTVRSLLNRFLDMVKTRKNARYFTCNWTRKVAARLI